MHATYFKGWGDPAPSGVIGQFSPEYAWPYEDWPDEVKHEYEYHPEEAEALLDEAGYPRGADGYRFKIKLGQFNRWEATYPEVVAGYLDAIGIETEFTILTQAENGAAMAADTHEWHLLAGYYGWTGGSAFMGYQFSSAYPKPITTPTPTRPTRERTPCILPPGILTTLRNLRVFRDRPMRSP